MVAEIAEEVEVVEIEDFEELAKKLENASPLEIMDKALEKYGNDIAIAFRSNGNQNVMHEENAGLEQLFVSWMSRLTTTVKIRYRCPVTLVAYIPCCMMMLRSLR
ncbi:unnamed protein product [Arabidopsis halleri]